MDALPLMWSGACHAAGIGRATKHVSAIASVHQLRREPLKDGRWVAGTVIASRNGLRQNASATIAASRSSIPPFKLRHDDMLTATYYALMLLVGYFCYRYGQNLLSKGLRDENDEITKPPVGPIGFVVIGGIACYLLFAAVRALLLREIPCVGKGCKGQIYTLAEHSGPYWANLFFVVWIVVLLGYAMYVTLKIWLRK